MKEALIDLIRLTCLHIYDSNPKHSFTKSIRSSTQKPIANSSLPPRPAAKIETIKPDFPMKPEAAIEKLLVKEAPALSQTTKIDLKDMERLFVEKLPHIKTIKILPDDSFAKSKAAEWETTPPAPLVFLVSNLKKSVFLQNVAHAVSAFLGPLQIVNEEELLERLNQESSAKLILIEKPSSNLHSLLETKSSQTCLKNIPALIFEPLEEYFKKPELKRTLWNLIKSVLKTA